MSTSSPTSIRHANALTCLQVLRNAQGIVSISDIANRSGLSRPTVDAVVSGFEAQGLVTEAPAGNSHATGGRPARQFRFAASSSIVAGIEASPNNIRIILADLGGGLQGRLDRPIVGPLTGKERIEAVISALEEALTRTGIPSGKLRAACVGVSGIIDANGCPSNSFVVPEWNGVDVAAAIAAAFSMHVFLENDMKLAGFAERHLGAAQQAEDFIYLQIDKLISMSLMINGDIHQGAHRFAGEIGSQRGMRWTSTSVQGHLTWSSAPTAELVFARAMANDPDAVKEIAQFISEIAPHIAMMGLVLDPELIVVGGGLSGSNAHFVTMLQDEVHRLVMLDAKPDMVASPLGSDGTLFGALALAFKQSSQVLFGFDHVPVPYIAHMVATQDTTPNPVRSLR